jgi:hypothetical protein
MFGKQWMITLLCYLFESITVELGWNYQENPKRTLSTRTGPGISPENIIKTVMQTI